MRSSIRGILLTAAAVAMDGSGLASAAMPAPRKGSSRDYKPRRVATQPENYELAREIAEHNAEVDRKRAEKKARKLAR